MKILPLSEVPATPPPASMPRQSNRVGGARRALKSVASKLQRTALRFLQDLFVYKPVIRRKGLSLDAPPLFDTVFFEVRTRCNAHCSFCAASVENDTRPDLSMSPDLHEKVLRELAANGFRGRIAYHNNSEPLIFRDLHLFVKRAKELVPDAYIQIQSNGRSLTLEKADALILAGIDELSINYYNDDFNRDLPRVLEDVATVVLPKYFQPDQVEISGVAGARSNPRAKFHYRVTRRLETEKPDSRAGTAPNKKIPDRGPRGFCQYPWTQLIVSADGRVPMCCADLNIMESVGNASSQTVLDIWRGAPLRKIRAALWRGDRQSISTCAQCDFYGIKKTPRTLIGKLVYGITRGAAAT